MTVTNQMVALQSSFHVDRLTQRLTFCVCIVSLIRMDIGKREQNAIFILREPQNAKRRLQGSRPSFSLLLEGLLARRRVGCQSYNQSRNWMKAKFADFVKPPMLSKIRCGATHTGFPIPLLFGG